MNWYDPLRNIQSRGSQADRPGSLAGLAARRREHQGQFFTPSGVAHLMWRIVEPAMEMALFGNTMTAARRRIAILDNSVGSARLLQYADPQKHELYGVDVDTELLVEVGKVVQAAGFHCEFEACGMEALRVDGFDVGLINPAFSVPLEAPTMEPFACTTYGRYGPNTSAVSHAYALAQAAEACQIVVALLPSTFAEEVWNNPQQNLGTRLARNLRGLIELPSGSFMEEGTNVYVSLLVMYSPSGGNMVGKIKLSSLEDPLPDFGFRIYGGGHAKMRVQGVEDSTPAITLPVTGDATVRVAHSSRKIGLQFNCGLTQAKVENAVLIERVTKMLGDSQRFPKGVRYVGQGALDVEVHLTQEDPMESLEALLSVIREAGGEPLVDPGLHGYLRRRIRQSRRQKTPLAHTVWMPNGVAGDADKIVGRARKQQVADPTAWMSPIIQEGEEVALQRQEDGSYVFQREGKAYQVPLDALHERFVVVEGAAEPGWMQVYPGLLKMFPEVAQSYRTRALSLGLDKWLSWDFQFDDAIELSMCPDGAICSWVMGLGKARLASALILLNGCRHGLIVTEAGLVSEMVMELKGLPISQEAWQVITKPEQLSVLRRINVIAYERLRLPIDRSRPHLTYGKQLRRRIGVLVADEGDVLANPESDQSRALAVVSPKKRYMLSGTLIANYPRDTLPVLAHTVGDGTAAQPWGWRGGYLEANWRLSMSYAKRGIDAFRDTFVTLDWVTKEFSDTMLEGAKREIPRIQNVKLYRQMLAPHVKRRILSEPEVAKHIHIPLHTREVVEVQWDPGHLSYYLEIAEEFASWYRGHMRDMRQRNNLIALLAHIRAVSFACDYPQHGVEKFGAYHALTSKHRWVIEELQKLAEDGHKTILYAENPGLLDILGFKLNDQGIGNVVFHGKKPIAQRTKELNERFRFGDCPVLLASLGVTQKGLNLHQADEVILLSRSWSATVEEQAIGRPLRPQQTRNVRVRYVHLPGSIDIYKSMLVGFKRDAARAGMDWATPETDGEEFLHLTTVIHRFVDGLAKFKNVERSQLRSVLKQEASYA